MGAVCALCRMFLRISDDVRRDKQHIGRVHGNPHKGYCTDARLRLSPLPSHKKMGARGQNKRAIMETRTCINCGRELPVTSFRLSKGGARVATCNECINEKRAETRYKHSQIGGGKTAPFSDPDFDGKTIGDVWRLMCRAEKWLESRGCVITLDGEFHETKIRKLKKE